MTSIPRVDLFGEGGLDSQVGVSLFYIIYKRILILYNTMSNLRKRNVVDRCLHFQEDDSHLNKRTSIVLPTASEPQTPNKLRSRSSSNLVNYTDHSALPFRLLYRIKRSHRTVRSPHSADGRLNIRSPPNQKELERASNVLYGRCLPPSQAPLRSPRNGQRHKHHNREKRFEESSSRMGKSEVFFI